MKKKIILISGIFALILVLALVSFYTLTRKTVDWDFIQRVGGIKTESPLPTEDGFYLPVICNVSGLDSVTVRPTTLNSALICLKTKPTIHENSIHLKVIAGLVLSKKEDCHCKAVGVGHLKRGTYIVYYGDKSSYEHQIGKFTIK